MDVIERLSIDHESGMRLTVAVYPVVLRNGYWERGVVVDHEATDKLLRLAKLGRAAEKCIASHPIPLALTNSLCREPQNAKHCLHCRWQDFCRERSANNG
jgi:hypothetical protein